jgi:hypothetical protein
MALDEYGVAIGTWYHGKIYLQTPVGEFECVVDVDTPSGVKVEYRVVPDLDRRLFAPIYSLSEGYHQLESTPTSGALDYVRSPLLNRPPGAIPNRCSPRRYWLGFLWQVIRYRWLRCYWQERLRQGLVNSWIKSTGNNALTILESNLSGSQRVYVFGEPYSQGRLGMHNVHYNQGDPPGPHRDEDGIWQDGGTIVEQPNGRLTAILTKFATQSLRTDENGWPA